MISLQGRWRALPIILPAAEMCSFVCDVLWFSISLYEPHREGWLRPLILTTNSQYATYHLTYYF